MRKILTIKSYILNPIFSIGLFTVHFIMLVLFVPTAKTQPSINLQQIATGFNRPVDIVHAGDNRLFIVEQNNGRIRIMDQDGNINPTNFLDIGSRVGSTANEQGLLGLAFHPNYASNGYFYVNYTATNGNTNISRFTVSANPDVANANSEVILLTVSQPYNNHNGGGIKFGPDGYLYIGMGDGGSGGDPGNRAQNTTNLLGKMLRIDVDGGSPYSIPVDNPFVNNGSVSNEIWAIGVRNPWRFSFDRQTGDLWIADVGQGDWEEINMQPAASNGGENYGWRCYEGNIAFETAGCSSVSSFLISMLFNR